jgi:Rrf2 family protein
MDIRFLDDAKSFNGGVIMINNRTKYAIRALWQLAESEDHFSTSEAIAHAHNIPVKFLPQILSDLSRAGMVRSVRGFGGGVRLSRPPEKITLLDILEITQGNIFMYDAAMRSAGGRREPDNALMKVYKKAQDAMKAEFGRVSLNDLKSKGKRKR